METRGTSAGKVKNLRQAEYYRVAAGDTLYTIAWAAGTDWRNLAAWNRLRYPYTIYPGQVLRLKQPRAATRPRTHAATTPKSRPPPASAKPSTVAAPDARGRTAVAPLPKPAPPPAPTGTGPLRWAWPTSGAVESKFVASDPARNGIKVTGRAGQAIRSAEAGSVVYSGSGLIGYGQLIIVKHNDKYLSAYGHNRKLLVKEGDRVAKGERIAEMGESNRGHAVLHFEIRREGKPVDPLRLLPPR